MYDFTQKKFLAFPLEWQHKKCAELLRRIYDHEHEDLASEHELYHTLLTWMQEPLPPLPLSHKALADSYHIHLQKAKISKKEHHLLPKIRHEDRLEAAEPWPIAIYLDELRSAHNVGSIIRTTEAFALGNLYFSASTPDASHKKVKDTAMGSNQWISCTQGVALETLPRPLIALETSEDAVSLYEFIFPSSFTLIVGNEEYGCSDRTLSVSDYLVEIPMRGRKNSLNVANAFAIAAGEISRQKSLIVRGNL